MFNTLRLTMGLVCGTWAACLGSESGPMPGVGEPDWVAETNATGGTTTGKAPAGTTATLSRLDLLVAAVARDLASATLAVEVPNEAPQALHALPTDGQPGDVRLVVATTDLAARKRWVVPDLPIPPFIQWGRWMEAHKDSTHCSLDWMDEKGRWWHSEIRGFNQHPEQYRVGEGEFPGTGITIYGVFILPGRTALENHDLVLDERIEMDYRLIEPMARVYGRKNKRPGEPGTGGDGSHNTSLGGPAFKPTQNSNTYISYLLRRAGVKHAAPDRAVGWDTKPHFPYSSDVQE